MRIPSPEHAVFAVRGALGLRHLLAALCMGLGLATAAAAADSSVRSAPEPYRVESGFVDSGGVMIYFETVGRGPPLMVLHGGPGADHQYFLPFLLPLARDHRLVFIDERGCGQSSRLPDPAAYTLANMAEDVEAVRRSLGLGQMDLLGHSFGGILAQAYALRHGDHLAHLILASTDYSAAAINADFARIRSGLTPGVRTRIAAFEKSGIYGPDGAYLPEYQRLVGEAELPYNYAHTHPSAGSAYQGISWEVLREMWGGTSDFVLDGNMKGFDFTTGLKALKVPTLVIQGDQDLISIPSARALAGLIQGSKLVILVGSAHMTFVDEPAAFFANVEDFLHASREEHP